MSRCRRFVGAGLSGLACLFAGNTAGHAQVCGGNAGPDVIGGDVPGMSNYASVDGIDAFALADTSCNIGTVNLMFQASTINHPVMAQNMYRHKTAAGDGRFEQIGMGWVSHEFTALTGNLCCTCSGQGGSVLGVGCASSDSSGWNGTQCTTVAGLGPRFEVNAHTGAFVWPYMFRNDCSYIQHTSTTRRLQARASDLNPSMNTGAQYFVEIQNVAPDDSAAHNQDNNASYRDVVISGADPNYSASMSGTTQRAKPAIRAWATIDPAVVLTDINTPEATTGDLTGYGILGCRVTDLGGGQYHYEYAVYNMNSDRSFSSFAVPSSPGLVVTNIGFHDVSYHSGDGYNSSPGNVINFDGTDWPGGNNGSAISWALVPAIPVENSNAIRWGTLYNFRFDCNAAPVNGHVTIGLFKSVAGLPDSMTVAAQVPGDITPCPADVTGDGTVNITDLLAVIAAWGLAGGPADVNGDNTVNIADLLAVIAAWGSCS